MTDEEMNGSQNNIKKKHITPSEVAFVLAAFGFRAFLSFKSSTPAIWEIYFVIIASLSAFILGLHSLLNRRKQNRKREIVLAVFSTSIPFIMFVIYIIYALFYR